MQSSELLTQLTTIWLILQYICITGVVTLGVLTYLYKSATFASMMFLVEAASFILSAVRNDVHGCL